MLIILFSFSAYGLTECRGTTSQDDIPCIVFLPRNDTDLNCDNVKVTFFRNQTGLYTQLMDNYTGSHCNATFNETMLGNYPISYSTGDTGSIIVEEGTEMILLLYFTAAILGLLILFGVLKEEVVSLSLGAFGLFIYGIFVFVNGFNGTANLLTNFLSILFIALGIFFLIPAMEWAISEMNMAGG